MNSVNGKYFETVDACNLEKDATSLTLNRWWDIFEYRQNNHIGSEWDGIRASDYPNADSSSFSFVRKDCSDWFLP